MHPHETKSVEILPEDYIEETEYDIIEVTERWEQLHLPLSPVGKESER